LYKDLEKLTGKKQRKTKFGLSKNWKRTLKIAGAAAAITGGAYAAKTLKEKQDLYTRYKTYYVMGKNHGITKLDAYVMAYIMIHPNDVKKILHKYIKNEHNEKSSIHQLNENLLSYQNGILSHVVTNFKQYKSKDWNDSPLIKELIKIKKWSEHTPPVLSDKEIKDEEERQEKFKKEKEEKNSSKFGLKFRVPKITRKNIIKGVVVAGGIGAGAYAAHSYNDSQKLNNKYKRIITLCKESNVQIKPLHAYAFAYMLIHPKKTASIIKSYVAKHEDYTLTEHAALQRVNASIDQINVLMYNKFKGYYDQNINIIPEVNILIGYNKWTEKILPKISNE